VTASQSLSIRKAEHYPIPTGLEESDMSLTMIHYTDFEELLRNLNWNTSEPFWLSSQACAFNQLHEMGLQKLPILNKRLDWLQQHQKQ